MTDHGCKVCRVLADRGLAGYDEKLLDRWLADGSRRMGYRSLAKWLNVTMLRREMDMAGISTLGDEAASKYERLTGADAVADEVRSALRTEGVPIDGLEADFVSYGVVRTHLVDCLGAEREPDGDGDWEREALEITREHAQRKAGEAIRSLVNKGELRSRGDLNVLVTLEVECEESHRKIPVERALRRGYVSDPETDDGVEETDADDADGAGVSPEPATGGDGG